MRLNTKKKLCSNHHSSAIHFALFGFTVILQHWLKIISNLEGSLSLALDLVDGDAVSNLDEGETLAVVDVKDTLYHIS